MPNWTRERCWNIDDGPKHVHQHHHVTRFWLEKRSAGGIIVYDVCYDDKFMDEAWRNTWLIQRGKAPVKWSGHCLPTWDPRHKDAYDDFVKEIVNHTSGNTLRLEGEIEVDGRKEAVTFFLVEGAVAHGNETEELLIIVSRDHAHPDQDGTAHAKPH